MNFEDNHSYVLRLARGGATHFALTEYLRFELEKVRNNEDIMALHGRLYKDLFLSQSGKAAQDTARISAEKYEAAFKDTQGFYSGINAATMSLVAGIPPDMVQMRANRLMEILPPTEALESEAKYFVEATRAESYLLLGDETSARQSFRMAVDHDPLNFIAHAATLKQFQMIEAYQGKNYAWLQAFSPPNTAQFAGHMFGIEGECDPDVPQLTEDQVQALRVQISELIQSEDIGFAYGALAAGSDILFAEIFLEEGGELHINLPIHRDLFLDSSVKPFGESWVARFEACIAQANSVSIASPNSPRFTALSETQSSLSSMGNAIRKGESLAVPSTQILIWDGKGGVTGTAADANMWNETARARHVIPYVGYRNKVEKEKTTEPPNSVFTLRSESFADVASFDDLPSVISEALNRRRGKEFEIKQILRVADEEHDYLDSELLENPMPGSVILTERIANYVTLNHADTYAVTLFETFDSGHNIYVLHEKGEASSGFGPRARAYLR